LKGGDKRIAVPSQSGKKYKTLTQTTKAKRTAGMAQGLEHMPSKHKALTSISNTPHKKDDLIPILFL
jgi:hypothetical protein